MSICVDKYTHRDSKDERGVNRFILTMNGIMSTEFFHCLFGIISNVFLVYCRVSFSVRCVCVCSLFTKTLQLLLHSSCLLLSSIHAIRFRFLLFRELQQCVYFWVNDKQTVVLIASLSIKKEQSIPTHMSVSHRRRKKNPWTNSRLL